VETEVSRMYRLLVGLPTVNVLGVVDWMPTTPLVVAVETNLADPECCDGCGVEARVKGRDPTDLSRRADAFVRASR
jgi:hypothetical protein